MSRSILVHVRLDSDDVEWMDSEAHRRGLTREWFVWTAVKELRGRSTLPDCPHDHLDSRGRCTACGVAL